MILLIQRETVRCEVFELIIEGSFGALLAKVL